MPMTALMPTDYERGVKDPADHVAPPPQRTGYVLDKDERARRAALAKEAADRLGGPTALSRWLGVADSKPCCWARGSKPVPTHHLEALEAILTRDDLPDAQRAKRTTTGEDPLRHDGMAWCPACANRVPASQMHDFDGRDWVTLRSCKACQCSTRITNDRAQASAQHARHCE